ncbi:MAG: hypothetical protein ACI8XZ_004659 [Gammaproteobacteria bacterium]|jgi:hypothetical protein
MEHAVEHCLVRDQSAKLIVAWKTTKRFLRVTQRAVDFYFEDATRTGYEFDVLNA